MKMIIAYIKPFKLDSVKEALQEIGVNGLTISEVRGFGRQKGHTEFYRGSEYHTDFVPKLKLEIVIPDALLDLGIKTITKHAHTGKIGDGKIFVLSIDKAIRVRTGETDEEAL